MTYSSGDLIRFTTVQSRGIGQAVMNVFDASADGNVNGDDLQLMTDAEAWLSLAFEEMSAHIANDYAPVEVRGFNITRHAPLPTVSWTTWAGGAATGEITAHGVCLLVLFRTARVRCLGRKFLGGLTEGDMVDGAWQSSLLVAGAAWATALMTDSTPTTGGATLRYVIQTKTGARETPLDVVVSSNPAYQRRRRPGRGV